MRKLALVAILALAAAPSISGAHGPSGSHEEDGSPAVWDNQVSCGNGTDTPAATLYAGTNGVEVCNDGAVVPVQGRVIATTDDGGYVAADGDNNNPGQAAGWARVDSSGVRCGDDNGRRDATHPTSADTVEDCG
jgi:hypothetical protein